MGANSQRISEIQKQTPTSEYPDFDNIESLEGLDIHQSELTRERKKTLRAVKENLRYDDKTRTESNLSDDGAIAYTLWKNPRVSIESYDKYGNQKQNYVIDFNYSPLESTNESNISEDQPDGDSNEDNESTTANTNQPEVIKIQWMPTGANIEDIDKKISIGIIGRTDKGNHIAAVMRNNIPSDWYSSLQKQINEFPQFKENPNLKEAVLSNSQVAAYLDFLRKHSTTDRVTHKLTQLESETKDLFGQLKRIKKLIDKKEPKIEEIDRQISDLNTFSHKIGTQQIGFNISDMPDTDIELAKKLLKQYRKLDNSSAEDANVRKAEKVRAIMELTFIGTQLAGAIREKEPNATNTEIINNPNHYGINKLIEVLEKRAKLTKKRNKAIQTIKRESNYFFSIFSDIKTRIQRDSEIAIYGDLSSVSPTLNTILEKIEEMHQAPNEPDSDLNAINEQIITKFSELYVFIAQQGVTGSENEQLDNSEENLDENENAMNNPALTPERFNICLTKISEEINEFKAKRTSDVRAERDKKRKSLNAKAVEQVLGAQAMPLDTIKRSLPQDVIQAVEENIATADADNNALRAIYKTVLAVHLDLGEDNEKTIKFIEDSLEVIQPIDVEKTNRALKREKTAITSYQETLGKIDEGEEIRTIPNLKKAAEEWVEAGNNIYNHESDIHEHKGKIESNRQSRAASNNFLQQNSSEIQKAKGDSNKTSTQKGLLKQVLEHEQNIANKESENKVLETSIEQLKDEIINIYIPQIKDGKERIKNNLPSAVLIENDIIDEDTLSKFTSSPNILISLLATYTEINHNSIHRECSIFAKSKSSNILEAIKEIQNNVKKRQIADEFKERAKKIAEMVNNGIANGFYDEPGPDSEIARIIEFNDSIDEESLDEIISFINSIEEEELEAELNKMEEKSNAVKAESEENTGKKAAPLDSLIRIGKKRLTDIANLDEKTAVAAAAQRVIEIETQADSQATSTALHEKLHKKSQQSWFKRSMDFAAERWEAMKGSQTTMLPQIIEKTGMLHPWLYDVFPKRWAQKYLRLDRTLGGYRMSGFGFGTFWGRGTRITSSDIEKAVQDKIHNPKAQLASLVAVKYTFDKLILEKGLLNNLKTRGLKNLHQFLNGLDVAIANTRTHMMLETVSKNNADYTSAVVDYMKTRSDVNQAMTAARKKVDKIGEEGLNFALGNTTQEVRKLYSGLLKELLAKVKADPELKRKINQGGRKVRDLELQKLLDAKLGQTNRRGQTYSINIKILREIADGNFFVRSNARKIWQVMQGFYGFQKTLTVTKSPFSLAFKIFEIAGKLINNWRSDSPTQASVTAMRSTSGRGRQQPETVESDELTQLLERASGGAIGNFDNTPSQITPSSDEEDNEEQIAA